MGGASRILRELCRIFGYDARARLTCRSPTNPANGVPMRIFLQIAFALSVLWSMSACTQSLNDTGVFMDQSRKSMIGR